MPDSHSVKGAIFAALRALSDLTHSSAYPSCLPYGSPTHERLRVGTKKSRLQLPRSGSPETGRGMCKRLSIVDHYDNASTVSQS